MGLRTKFNLTLLFVALVGVALFALATTPVLEGVARQEVLQSSRIMMESAAGTRKYTSQQIAPLLAADMGTTFHPQAVSAYAAKKNFDVLHAKFTDYSYREAALNPTNLEDRATDWEADIINNFRPVVNTAACMTCHDTADAAPKSMVAIYGARNGFGWKLGEIIGAQIVSVPMAAPIARAGQIRLLFLAIYGGVFALLFLLLNLLLGVMVIGPIDRMARTAEAVSLGDMDAPEYVRGGSDQIAGLSSAINRLRRSLKEALRMLSEG
jgi:protein-histidine pros-kinase